MDIQIKKAIKAGNSSAVILPRSWLNKDVRVELLKKTPEKILSEVIEILEKNIEIKNVIGIYLTGSYARGEEDENSDLDILVVTKGIDKEMINEGIYNILIVSTELIKQKLDQDLFPIGSMLKEAKSLLNSNYLDMINIKVTEKNVGWYIQTTEEKLGIIKSALDMEKGRNKEYVSDLVLYTIILRIRTLFLIENIIKKRNYSKKDFKKIIKKISGGTNSYRAYLDVKNDLKEGKNASLEEAERLYEYLKDQLAKTRKLLKG